MTKQQNTPELRFPEFKDKWKEHILEYIFTKKSSKNKENTFNETLTNSAEFGIISQKDYFDKDISNAKILIIIILLSQMILFIIREFQS